MFDLANARETVDVEIVDLREYPLPFFDEPGGNVPAFKSRVDPEPRDCKRIPVASTT
jgi:hypothetical protein